MASTDDLGLEFRGKRAELELVANAWVTRDNFKVDAKRALRWHRGLQWGIAIFTFLPVSAIFEGSPQPPLVTHDTSQKTNKQEAPQMQTPRALFCSSRPHSISLRELERQVARSGERSRAC